MARLLIASATGSLLVVLLIPAASAWGQECLGLPSGGRHHAIGARLEPLAGARREAWLFGGEYRNVGRRVAIGVHAGGVYEELIPPGDVVAGIGGSAALLPGTRAFCPAISVTRWSPPVEGFSVEPGDSDLSVLLFRFGVGLARATGDSVRVVGWLYPHISLTREHSRFADMESTSWETEVLTDIGAAVAGGRFWGSGALRFQFADDPGEDIPFGAVFMAGVGVRF